MWRCERNTQPFLSVTTMPAQVSFHGEPKIYNNAFDGSPEAKEARRPHPEAQITDHDYDGRALYKWLCEHGYVPNPKLKKEPAPTTPEEMLPGGRLSSNPSQSAAGSCPGTPEWMLELPRKRPIEDVKVEFQPKSILRKTAKTMSNADATDSVPSSVELMDSVLQAPSQYPSVDLGNTVHVISDDEDVMTTVPQTPPGEDVLNSVPRTPPDYGLWTFNIF